MTRQYALVALPLPLATPYTYRIPEALGDRVGKCLGDQHDLDPSRGTFVG